MNLLSDTLKDFQVDVDKLYLSKTFMKETEYYSLRDKVIEEYVERIKNELNIEKYLK
jgi:hypothetical protein